MSKKAQCEKMRRNEPPPGLRGWRKNHRHKTSDQKSKGGFLI